MLPPRLCGVNATTYPDIARLTLVLRLTISERFNKVSVGKSFEWMVREKANGKANRLAESKSPYLRLHAYDPVNWYPWGEEAIREAKQQDKPILLSIGYASCHWCHVMHRESFMDPRIAGLINTYFVPVKVDREERPDIDSIYMRAVMLMTGHGGWPLTVFLTPELKPFFGGTYFPPSRRGGLPSFKEVLLAVRDAWSERRKEIFESGSNLFSVVTEYLTVRPQSASNINRDIMTLAFDQAVLVFDEDFGGIKGAPKFPTPLYHMFLTRYWRLYGQDMALKMVDKSLKQMWMGGIYDHVGGGFHRYSVDRSWSVPHFEKMLYDNAALLTLYTEMYVASRNELYRYIAGDIARWMMDEIRSGGGGFYSSLDAESGGREGGYYLYKWEEVSSVLGEDVARLLGCSPGGNAEEGLNVIKLNSPEQVSQRMGASLPEALRAIRGEVSKIRRGREPPMKDEKIIAAWNGLAISGLAYFGAVSRDERLVEAASTCADFLLSNLYLGGDLRRFWRDGPSDAPGLLEDYALLGCGLLDLYQWSGRYRYLESALDLAQAIRKKFLSSSGGFYDTPAEHDVPLRPMIVEDGSYPSGYGAAVKLFGQLHLLTLEEWLLEVARDAVKCAWDRLVASPLSHLSTISAVPFVEGLGGELVVATPGDDPRMVLGELAEKIYEPYIVIAARRGEILRTLMDGKDPISDKPTFYLCRAAACQKPTTDITELINQLRGFLTP